MRRWRLLASLVFLASIGAGGEDAAAETFCVNKFPCLGISKATIQEALNTAAGSGSEDTIYIDDNGGTPYNETLSYVDAETVHLIGDGVGQTIVQGTNSASNAATLLSPTSTIEHLTLRAPDISNGAALRWNGTASDIEAVHLGLPTTETLGMVAEGNAILEDSTVEINGFGLFDAEGATNAKIRDSFLTGDGAGIAVGGADLTLERSTVVSKRSPVQAGSGSTVNIHNDVLRMGESLGGDAAVSILSGGEAVVRHATILGAGVGRGVAVDATSNSATVNVFDSIIHNFQTALLCAGGPGHEAILNVSYSNWTDPTQLTDEECHPNTATGNDVATEPAFVSTNPLLPNFRLRAPSPLIDAAGPGDPLTEDLVGAPRVVDGDGVGGARSDMGAYEYQRQPPNAVINAPGTATVGDTTVFSATGSSDPDPGDILAFSWDFGDGGTGEGFAPSHTFTSGGTYTVELTVTDPTGLSDTASALVEVPATATAPASDKPGKGPKQKSPKQPKAKAIATISELRAVPKRIRRGKGLPKLVKGLKRPGFQFKLSKKAGVTLKLVRCKGKRGCRKRVRIKGAPTFTASKGNNTIKFRGRLTRRKLRRGRYRATVRVAGGNALSTPFRLR